MDERLSTTIEREVTSWLGVTVTTHSMGGGLEFRYGRVELGHLHGDACADLPFTRKIRDELIATGRASVHPPLPDSGWVRREIAGSKDIAGVVALFRRNYDRASARATSPAGAAEGATASPNAE